MAYLTKMTTRIFHFPYRHFERKKQPPLSSQIVVTLLAACAKQAPGIHFIPGDVKGSFALLITRGLVIPKYIPTDYGGSGRGNFSIEQYGAKVPVKD